MEFCNIRRTGPIKLWDHLSNSRQHECSIVLFDAGALSKLQHSSKVCTFLLDVKPNEVRQPMGQFQCTSATREDVFRLGEAWILLPDGTHGTRYKVNRRFLSK